MNHYLEHQSLCANKNMSFPSINLLLYIIITLPRRFRGFDSLRVDDRSTG